MKKYFYSIAIACTAMMFASCSSDDSTPSGNTDYSNRTFGVAAMSACDAVCDQFTAADNVIQNATLSTEQEAFLKKVIANEVDNVIVPTYTKLADAAEDLEKTLNGLDVNTVTQADLDRACDDFKACRMYWEQSEAFLGGAASEFGVDPTIDSWPLSRSVLLNYFSNGMKESDLSDESVLGFHALEFILFRDGQPRTVAAFQTNDTYPQFQNVKGSDELKYAQVVVKLLKERTFQLQVAWEGETAANKSRLDVVKAAGLDYLTAKGLSFGTNLKQAGNSQSTFSSIKDVITQLLSDDEGSCLAIANEVGTAKIGNPFSKGDVSYVESPYSQRSIIDFQDNMRSVRNIWCGSMDGSTAQYSFSNFFRQVNRNDISTSVESAYISAIEKIGQMPAPFVKYITVLTGKDFSQAE